MQKTILIQNYHSTATRLIVEDFKNIGYEVIMPCNNWQGMIKYFFSNEGLGGKLVTYDEFIYGYKDADILIACIEQQNDFLEISKFRRNRIILHTGQNNDPYHAGISQHLMAGDIQLYNRYDCANKMLYFMQPIIPEMSKDFNKCWKNKVFNTYIHSYQKFFPVGYGKMIEFQDKFSIVNSYGFECDKELTHVEVLNRMNESTFTMFFKDKEAYGLMVIESMLMQTPVVTLKSFIEDKTLGQYFLNDGNSIIGDTVDDCISKIMALDIDIYTRMCVNARDDAMTLTNNKNRRDQLKAMLLK